MLTLYAAFLNFQKTPRAHWLRPLTDPRLWMVTDAQCILGPSAPLATSAPSRSWTIFNFFGPDGSVIQSDRVCKFKHCDTTRTLTTPETPPSVSHAFQRPLTDGASGHEAVTACKNRGCLNATLYQFKFKFPLRQTTPLIRCTSSVTRGLLEIIDHWLWSMHTRKKMLFEILLPNVWMSSAKKKKQLPIWG